jgi:hypothetical protein
MPFRKRLVVTGHFRGTCEFTAPTAAGLSRLTAAERETAILSDGQRATLACHFFGMVQIRPI